MRYAPRICHAALALMVAAAATAAPPNEGLSAPQPVPIKLPSIAGPKDNKAKWMVELTVQNSAKGSVTWRIDQYDPAVKKYYKASVERYIDKTAKKIIFSGPAGHYQVEAEVRSGDDVEQLLWEGDITGDGQPVPVPVPPGPGPGPGPTPAPTDANPFGELPGLHVFIVYEEREVQKYPFPQQAIIRGAKFRDYVDTKCVDDGYRFLDQNVKITTPGAWFESALKKTDRKSLPWLYAGSGKVGISAPLPASADEAIALISKLEGK